MFDWSHIIIHICHIIINICLMFDWSHINFDNWRRINICLVFDTVECLVVKNCSHINICLEFDTVGTNDVGFTYNAPQISHVAAGGQQNSEKGLAMCVCVHALARVARKEEKKKHTHTYTRTLSPRTHMREICGWTRQVLWIQC